MTITVSFTDFRNNLSSHLRTLKKGDKVTIRDEKKGEDLLTLAAEKEKEFDWDAHIKWMKNFKPFLTEADVAAYRNRRKRSRARIKRNNYW